MHARVVHSVVPVQSSSLRHATQNDVPSPLMQYGSAAVQPSWTPSPLLSVVTQPRKNELMGGAQRPVPSKHTPLGHMDPVVQLPGVPVWQTKSFWMPVELEDVPAYASKEPSAP